MHHKYKYIIYTYEKILLIHITKSTHILISLLFLLVNNPNIYKFYL